VFASNNERNSPCNLRFWDYNWLSPKYKSDGQPPLQPALFMSILNDIKRIKGENIAEYIPVLKQGRKIGYI
jgi:hypothetical protein